MTGWLDLWLLRLPRHDLIADLLDRSDLDDRERERGAAFVRPPDSVLYLAAHIALRRVLATYLAVPAREVVFLREPCPGCGGPHGRPAVAAPGPPLHFSLSHSGGAALVAVASDPVGADVERTPEQGTVEVCMRSLHPDERAELVQTPTERQREAFGRIWTRKEAYLKGLGTGLSRAPALDYLGDDGSRRPDGWSVLDVPCPPGHSGAVAVRGRFDRPNTVHRLPVRTVLTAGPSSEPPGPARPPAAIVLPPGTSGHEREHHAVG